MDKLSKYEATVVMINELERLFKEQHNSGYDYDNFVCGIINMVFSTINEGIKQIDEKY